MKSLRILITLLSFTAISFSAVAAENTTLVVALGGMGTDGASLEPFPKKNSVADAEAIYNALNVKPQRGGKKIVGFKYQDDVIGLECDKPNTGIHTRTAGCEYMTILKEKAPKNGIAIYVGTIALAPVSSQKIFEALNVVDDSGRVGAVVKEVGNLTCTRGVYPKAVAKCELRNVTISKMSIDQIPAEEQEGIRKLAKKLGL